ncbi:hypothetical protein [Mesorhizobium sp.]|uniref:hypothetical protein n=1 Tax=Mesorhizobium sp. TaxID=1871066 RepID=UPI002579F42A|nr:hypothetical protein [Mesorhizobium sp.]
MATIPLQLAQRRLDTGSVVSYPDGSPIGAAMQGFGDELSAVAERFRQQKQQQDAFDAEVIGRELNGQIAQAENEAIRNAPADGRGLHDAMYGQVDPRTGQVIKSGLFDTLFDGTLPKVPESERANFIRKKEALRLAGSARMAAQQYARRQDYEQTEWSKAQDSYTTAIAQSDPDDTAAFEAIRQSGFDFIAKMGNAVARQAAETAWRSNTAKALAQARTAKDPGRSVELLGAEPAAKVTIGAINGETTGAEGGTDLSAKNPNSPTSGDDRLADLRPDDRAALARLAGASVAQN